MCAYYKTFLYMSSWTPIFCTNQTKNNDYPCTIRTSILPPFFFFFLLKHFLCTYFIYILAYPFNFTLNCQAHNQFSCCGTHWKTKILCVAYVHQTIKMLFVLSICHITFLCFSKKMYMFCLPVWIWKYAHAILFLVYRCSCLTNFSYGDCSILTCYFINECACVFDQW